MAVRPEAVEEWFYFMPNLLEDEGWQTAVSRQSAVLARSHCPWGGSLVRFKMGAIRLAEPPEEPQWVIMRPETRSSCSREHPEWFSGPFDEQMEVMHLLAPGEIVARWRSCFRFLKLCGVLFGTMGPGSQSYFYQPSGGYIEAVTRFRRNFPRDGDSCYSRFIPSEPFESLTFARPEGHGSFALYVIFRVSQDVAIRQPDPVLEEVLDASQETACWFLNRPGIREMRQLDQNLYVVLRMQSLRRGKPFLPALSGEAADVTIDAGVPDGLQRWVRYCPDGRGRPGFRLSDFLKKFLNRLGLSLSVYESLDGQQLLPYQCVVASQAWHDVRDLFQRAYLLQKTAYRRANGGAFAPGITEGTEPRFCQEICLDSLQRRLREATGHQEVVTVVRKTFLEVADEVAPPSACGRSRTASPPRLGEAAFVQSCC